MFILTLTYVLMDNFLSLFSLYVKRKKNIRNIFKTDDKKQHFSVDILHGHGINIYNVIYSKKKLIYVLLLLEYNNFASLCPHCYIDLFSHACQYFHPRIFFNELVGIRACCPVPMVYRMSQKTF